MDLVGIFIHGSTATTQATDATSILIASIWLADPFEGLGLLQLRSFVPTSNRLDSTPIPYRLGEVLSIEHARFQVIDPKFGYPLWQGDEYTIVKVHKEVPSLHLGMGAELIQSALAYTANHSPTLRDWYTEVQERISGMPS